MMFFKLEIVHNLYSQCTAIQCNWIVFVLTYELKCHLYCYLCGTVFCFCLCVNVFRNVLFSHFFPSKRLTWNLHFDFFHSKYNPSSNTHPQTKVEMRINNRAKKKNPCQLECSNKLNSASSKSFHSHHHQNKTVWNE